MIEISEAEVVEMLWRVASVSLVIIGLVALALVVLASEGNFWEGLFSGLLVGIGICETIHSTVKLRRDSGNSC